MSAGTASTRKPPASTVSPSEIAVTSPPLRSRASSAMPRRHDERADRPQCLAVEMVGVAVRREHDVDERELLGRDDRRVIWTCGVSLPSYFSVSESER